MDKIKNFSRLVRYEFLRLFRNKIMISLLLLFSVILLAVLFITGETSNGLNNATITVYTGGKDIQEIQALDVFESNYNIKNFVCVDSIEEGINSVKYENAVFFIEVNNETNPETLVLHYDGYSSASNNLKEVINNQKNTYSYETIKNFLEDYGITINRAYFETVSFSSINDANGLNVSSTFVIGVASGLSIMMLFGLAYSISRDNETSVSKILSYMPVNTHAFLWSKIVTYLIIGVLELILLLIVGVLFFDISFQVNFLMILLVSFIFLLATICLGTVFSSFKSQVITVLLSISVILIPLLLMNIVVLQAMIVPLKIMLFIMPITPFIQLLHGMLFNGIINWWYVLILIVEIIIYYLVAYVIIQLRIKKH